MKQRRYDGEGAVVLRLESEDRKRETHINIGIRLTPSRIAEPQLEEKL